jgi:hypothetical protein
MNKKAKGKKPISILSTRSPSLSSYSPTPSPEPLPYKKESPTPEPTPKPESRTISPTPLRTLSVPPLLNERPTLTIPNGIFTPDQIQFLADFNPSLRTDCLGNFGTCTYIEPHPLAPTCTVPSSSAWADDVNLDEPAPNGPTWKGVPDHGPGLGGSPGPPVLEPRSQRVDNSHPIPEQRPRTPPKTFSEVISGTTPHTESYDAQGTQRDLRCPSPPRIYPITAPLTVPTLPSERAGIPANVADAIRILPGPNPKSNPTQPISIPDSRREAMRLWDGPALRHSGTFRAMVGSPDHFTRFGTEYLHNADQRNQWCLIGDAVQKLERLHRNYVDTARRTALLVTSARSLGLPEAYAQYVGEVKVDPFPPSRRSGIATNGIHHGPDPTPIPATTSDRLPPTPLRNEPRRSIPGTKGSVPTVTPRPDGVHRPTPSAQPSLPKPLIKPIPTKPRAMRNEFDPNATCLKCKRLNLPNLGHWANNCPNTICSLCKKSAPGHYKYGCPRYICTCCHTANPGHKPTECPELPARQEAAEAMRRRTLGYNNSRAEIENGDWDDTMDVDYSCESA